MFAIYFNEKIKDFRIMHWWDWRQEIIEKRGKILLGVPNVKNNYTVFKKQNLLYVDIDVINLAHHAIYLEPLNNNIKRYKYKFHLFKLDYPELFL